MSNHHHDTEEELDEEASLFGKSVELEEKGLDTATKKPATTSFSYIRNPLTAAKKKLQSETCHCITALVVLSFILAGCVVSFFYCNVCLIGVIIVSACMCPWIPYFNIPLWISIFLLVFMGWNFSSRKFHFIWE